MMIVLESSSGAKLWTNDDPKVNNHNKDMKVVFRDWNDYEWQ